MTSYTVKLPAFLASALVNGDTSGLTCTCGAEEKSRSVTEIDAWGHARVVGGHHEPAKHTGDCDFRWLAEALAYVAPGRIVSAEGESYFSRCGGDLPGFNLGADVLDYVVLEG